MKSDKKPVLPKFILLSVPFLLLPDPVFDLRSFLRLLHLHRYMLFDVRKIIG